MAANDFMIGLRIDTARAQKDVASFYSYLESQQGKAAAKGARVAQLPKNAVRGAFGDAADPTGLRKSTTLQKQFIADKAKLLGLLERQVALSTQAAGGRLNKQGLPTAAAPKQAIADIRSGVEASIARSLGLEQLTPALKGQLTKALNGVRTNLSSALSGLSGVDLQREFSRQATTILGTTNVDAFKANTVAAEKAAAQSQAVLANLAREAEASGATAASTQRRQAVNERLSALMGERLVAARKAAGGSKGDAVISGRISESEARILGLSQERANVLNRVISKTRAAEAAAAAAAAYKADLTGQTSPANRALRALSVSRAQAAPQKYKEQLLGTTDPITRALRQTAVAGIEEQVARNVVAQKNSADAAQRAAALQNRFANLSAEEVAALNQSVTAAAAQRVAMANSAEALAAKASADVKAAASAQEIEANQVQISAAQERVLASILASGGGLSSQYNTSTLKALEARGLVSQANVLDDAGRTQRIVQPTDLGLNRTKFDTLPQQDVAALEAARGARIQAEQNAAASAAKEAAAAAKSAANEEGHTARQQSENAAQEATERSTTSSKRRESAGAAAQAAGEGAGGSRIPPPPGGGSFFPPEPPDDINPPDGFDDGFDAEFQAEQRLAAATQELAVLRELTADALRPLYAAQLARIKLENQVIENSALAKITGDEKLLTQYGGAEAARRTYRSQLNAATETELLNNPALNTASQEANATANVHKQLRVALEKYLIATTGLSREVIQSKTLEELSQATLRNSLAVDESYISARADNVAANKRATIAAERAYIQSGQAAILEPQLQSLRDERKKLRTGGGGILQRFGYDRTGGTSLREFFGGGALASLRHVLPSLLLYSGLSGIANTTREAEELNYALSILEGQFEATFEGQDFSPVRQQILDIAQDTGLAADELALLRVQLTGAFGEESIGGFSGADLIEEQTLAAAKLAQTVKLPLEEITDGLTAASLAFEGATFERIGDVAVRLEEVSGVLAKETVSFIGDIAPVAEEAGYSLEEFSAIAAVAQQRSGRSGAALAEAFGRVVPSITKAKDELFALASTEDALANADFIDAIRQSDPKAILEQIGAAYADVSDRGQQQITQILGGRREAQVIIPVITNQDAIEEFTREAENSAGSLDRRFERVRETLTNTFQRLSEKVRKLVYTILDSGITDLLEEVANILGSIANILSPILGIVGEINSGLAGWPVRILAALAAYKTFVAFRQAEDTRRGAFAGGIASIPGRIGSNFNRGIQASALRQGIPGNLTTSGLGALSNVRALGGSGLRAAGAGGLAVLGGGSVATGGLLLAAIAITAGYSALRGQIDQENKKLEDLTKEISEENAELDVYNPETSDAVRERRISNLEDQAADLQRSYENSAGFFERVNVAILGAQSEAELTLAEAARLDAFDPETSDFFNSLDLGLERDITEQLLPKLGKPLSDFRGALEEDIIEQYGTAGDKTKDALGKIFSPGTFFDEALYDPGFSEEEQKYIDDIAALAGVARDELDLRIVKLIADHSDNAVGVINDLLSDKVDPSELGITGSLTDHTYEQLGSLAESLKNEAENNPEIQASIDALASIEELSPFEQSTLAYEKLGDAFEAGLLTLEEYATKLAENTTERRNALNLGTETAASEEEILKFIISQREDAKMVSQAIVEQQERVNSIYEALGASDEDLEFRGALNSVANLDDPNFRDRDARLEAAVQLQQARTNTAIRLATEAGNLAEVNRLLAEGIEVEPDVRSVLYTEKLLAEDDTIQKLASSYLTVASNLKSNLDVMDNPDFSSAVLSSLALPGEDITNVSTRLIDELGVEGFYRELDAAAGPILEALNEPIEQIIEGTLKDIFEDGVLSPGNLSRLNIILSGVGRELQVEGLTGTQINALYGTLEGVVQLLAFAGVARDEILAVVAPNAGFFESIPIKFQVDKALGGSQLDKEALEKARVAQEAAEDDKIREAGFNLRKARADQNNSLIAAIEVEAAEAEKLAAEQTDDIARKKEAEVRLVKAKQQQDKAAQDVLQAGFDLRKAYAEVSGNSVQAAILEAASIQSRLDFAEAAGSDTTDSIRAELVRAEDAIRKQLIADQTSNYELLSAMADFNGDTVGVARVGVAQAQFVLDNAVGLQERNNAKVGLLQAQKQLRDALRQQRSEQFDLLTAIVAGEDPLAEAQIAQAEAKEVLQNAVGPSEIAQAKIGVIEADRAVNKAMQDIRSSLFDLRQAQLDAVGDEVGSAQVAAQQARQQLQDAIANKAGAAQINSLRAQVITADKAAKDAVFDERRDEYDFLFEMGQITKSQYINYLEGLKSTLIPGTAQFRDLELAIKRLKDDVSGDLQSNLPTSLALPTLYEVRRLAGTNPNENVRGTSVGYQDNRQMDVKVYIDGNMSEDQVVSALSKAVGLGNNGQSVRLY